MKHTKILIADNIDSNNQTDSRRSKFIRKVGQELATTLKSKVDFLFVEDLKDLVSLDYAKEIQKNHLSELKKIERSSAILSTYFKTGSPSQEIIKFINKNSPELVVIGTQGKRGLEKLFLGSVAEEVVRNSRKPVLVLGPKTIRDNFKLPKTPKILLATDLSETSDHAEKYAMKLAKQLKAEVTIFYSEWEQIKHLQETMYVTGLPIVLLNDPTDDMKKYISKEFSAKEKTFEKNKITCKYTISSHPSPLDQLLTKEASKDYSLIVMGTQNRNKFMKFFLGSNARKVILNSPIPVIIVHS